LPDKAAPFAGQLSFRRIDMLKARKGKRPMIGTLTDEEIDALLGRQRIGHIGGTAAGHVLIEPIIYGYDGEAIYGHSQPGRKIQYLRNHHEVCFEVEEIDSPNSWRVVILTGIYHELQTPEERSHAMRMLMSQAGGGPFSAATRAKYGEELVFYRIEISQRSGRYEQLMPEDELRGEP
jgi:uncharacterized protein